MKNKTIMVMESSCGDSNINGKPVDWSKIQENTRQFEYWVGSCQCGQGQCEITLNKYELKDEKSNK